MLVSISIVKARPADAQSIHQVLHRRTIIPLVPKQANSLIQHLLLIKILGSCHSKKALLFLKAKLSFLFYLFKVLPLTSGEGLGGYPLPFAEAGRGYLTPPPASIVLPVNQRDSSEARNTATGAMS